jgi:hypothetical protein
MKNNRLCIFLFLMVTLNGFAQEQLDRIVKLDGTILRGNVMSIDDRFLRYSLPGRSTAILVHKSCVFEVKYASGRTELVNQKIVVNSTSDWKNVKFTANPSDTECLQFQGIVEEHTKEILGFLRLSRSDIPLVRKIKKRAARNKAHIIYLAEPPADFKYQSWQFPNLIYGRCFSY